MISDNTVSGEMLRAKYRKTALIEASRWFKNGDHPDDVCETLDAGSGPFQGEGHVVRYYRHPDDDGERLCVRCGVRMHEHGRIDTREGGHIACPGDWIATGVHGEHWPIKPDIFAASYEPAASSTPSVDGEMLVALKTVADWLDDDRIGTIQYMEGSGFYDDKSEHLEALRFVVARAESAASFKEPSK